MGRGREGGREAGTGAEREQDREPKRGGCLDVELPDAADMLGVDVPGPLDDVRDDESLHQPVVGGVDVEGGHGTSVEWVHGAERANHVRVHCRPVAACLEVLPEGVVLPLLVHPGGDQGVLPVLVGHHDVDDGDVWAQQAWRSRDLLVVVDDASGIRILR